MIRWCDMAWLFFKYLITPACVWTVAQTTTNQSHTVQLLLLSVKLNRLWPGMLCASALLIREQTACGVAAWRRWKLLLPFLLSAAEACLLRSLGDSVWLSTQTEKYTAWSTASPLLILKRYAIILTWHLL